MERTERERDMSARTGASALQRATGEHQKGAHPRARPQPISGRPKAPVDQAADPPDQPDREGQRHGEGEEHREPAEPAVEGVGDRGDREAQERGDWTEVLVGLAVHDHALDADRVRRDVPPQVSEAVCLEVVELTAGIARQEAQRAVQQDDQVHQSTEHGAEPCRAKQAAPGAPIVFRAPRLGVHRQGG